MKKKRSKKEAAKTEELVRKTTTALLTQGAASERKKDADVRLVGLKDTMKRLAAAVTAKELGTSATSSASDAGKAVSGQKKSKNVVKKTAARTVVAPMIVVKAKKVPVAQGLRQVPKALDEHGCRHSGVRDLVVLQKNYLMKYVKVGGWLHQKPCKGCADDTNEVGDRDRVMDMSTLLSLKGNNNGVGYICNCGPVGHGMEDGNTTKEEFMCDMVLCMGCYTSRMIKADSSDGNKRTRRKRKL